MRLGTETWLQRLQNRERGSQKAENFSKRNESFTTTWEFAKFWGVSQTNFEDKFLYFSIVEIFHALMTVLLWFSLIQLRFLAILLYLWNRQL